MADHVLTEYDHIREAYRQKALKQALYDAGGVVMADTLLTLWGDDHRQRRRLENRLFRRETFEFYESELMPGAIKEVLDPAQAQGEGDVVPLSRRIVVNLTAMAAGVDRVEGTPEETDRIFRYAVKFSEGATAVHSTRDPEELTAEVATALEAWDEEFLAPSIARRERLLEGLEAGEVAESDLPPDVLMILMRNQDNLDLSRDVIRREVAFYMLAGMHSTAAASTHAVHEIFEWLDADPGRADQLLGDELLLQRCVHESMRLHPASPVAMREAIEPIDFSWGLHLEPGDTVTLDLMSGNRDTAVFGEDAAAFNPDRSFRDDVQPWGHSFGGGRHACIGMELDGGIPPDPDGAKSVLLGSVALIVEGLLQRGARRDPQDPPTQDETTTRKWWGRYPVLFS
ncbi:MAG: cytochrome P450 [Acidimicrobiales bacterium]